MPKLLLTLIAWAKETTQAFRDNFVDLFESPTPFQLALENDLVLLPSITDLGPYVNREVLLQRVSSSLDEGTPWPPFWATVQDTLGVWVRLRVDEGHRFWIHTSDYTLLEIR